MKNIKKIIVVLVTLCMLLSMGTAALAAGAGSQVDGTDITITGAINGASYSAYRLLDTTTSLKVPGCHNTDSEHISTCYNIAYSVNNTYFELLKTATGMTSGEDIIAHINGLTAADAIRAFADNMYSAISKTTIPADSSAIGVDGKAVLDDVAQGYWLIVETINEEGYAGAYSLVMLDTAGSRDITVTTKREEPTLIKYVRDNGMSYGHGADMQIGDKAEFLLITDVPDPIGYGTYTYVIHDKMGEGLTFDANSVSVRLNTVDGTVLDPSYYTVNPSVSCDKGCSFHISVDIKAATAAGALKGDDRLYVAYTATLNEEANILAAGQNLDNANPNTAWLQYSNNPYDPNASATSAPMTVYVWTFPLTLNKVDNVGAGLTGAKFVLSLNKSLTDSDLADPAGCSDIIPLIDKGNNTYRVAPAGYTGAVVYEIPVGSAVLQGFDDQVEYYLYETAAPAGYNKLSTPVSFKFFVQYASDSAKMAEGYPKVSINAAPETGELKANVVNQTGIELPSTGGMGTTMLYVVGAILVLGAAVLLVTRKRVGTEK